LEQQFPSSWKRIKSSIFDGTYLTHQGFDLITKLGPTAASMWIPILRSPLPCYVHTCCCLKYMFFSCTPTRQKTGRPLHSMMCLLIGLHGNSIPNIGCHYFWPGLIAPFLRTHYLFMQYSSLQTHIYCNFLLGESKTRGKREVINNST
jgi:hypothetical protein